MNRTAPFVVIIAAILCAGATVRMQAQSPPTPSSAQEAAALAEGWASLAKGDANAAALAADRILARSPGRVSAASLAVEAEIWRGGADAGLRRYEQWLAGRAGEEPALVRRIAEAFLWGIATGGRPSAAEALRILTASGDTEAGVALANRAAGGSTADARALAQAGDERGVRRLIDAMPPNAPPSLSTIDALGRSGHPLALPVLLAQARAADPAVRQAAMEALGYFDDPRAITALRAGLNDDTGLVRGKAAAALYRLGDAGGMAVIEELVNSDSADGRLAGARYLASRPDSRFLALVRSLAGRSQPPDIRLAAARLLAPHDPEEAARVLREIGANTALDLAVREEAVRAQSLALPDDLRALRTLLQEPDDGVRLGAAERILVLTQ